MLIVEAGYSNREYVLFISGQAVFSHLHLHLMPQQEHLKHSLLLLPKSDLLTTECFEFHAVASGSTSTGYRVLRCRQTALGCRCWWLFAQQQRDMLMADNLLAHFDPEVKGIELFVFRNISWTSSFSLTLHLGRGGGVGWH